MIGLYFVFGGNTIGTSRTVPLPSNLTLSADKKPAFLHLWSMGSPCAEVELQAQLCRSPRTAAQVFDHLTPAQHGANKTTMWRISRCQ